jgi:3-hydroxy acid dehydrogenase/malonic semialdehyde reductase
MGRLDGRIAVITGASSGIGAATARAFAAEGAQLVLGARRTEKLEALRASLLQDFPGRRIDLHPLDVRVPAQVAAFAHAALSLGPIEVLVNNAGLARGAEKLVDSLQSDHDEMLQTNVVGLFAVTRAFLPAMVKERRGTIVQLGSVAGNEPYPGGTMYCATKAAVHAMSKALRHELLGTGVRVVTIEPGLCDTEFALVRFHGDAARAKSPYAGMTPLTGEDVADVIAFAVTRPPHVVLEEVTLYPVDQASTTAVHRRT